jgi:hypothetical protein
MPKEKSTTATTRTKRATKGEGRKKKGMYPRRRLATLAMLTFSSDPNQPKRGLSAYMFFANEQRDKVREDNPGIKFGMLLLPSTLHSHQLANMLQARSARSSASNGSRSTTSRRSLTMPRPRPTSSATRRRRPPTLPYVDEHPSPS